MTLLAPLAGAVAAALGLGVLIALSALKLRRRPVRVSSTLLWKHAALDLEVNTPWRAPRPTVLLLLQALAVLLLALAIARPILGSAERVPDRIILVLDASASMSAADAGPGANPPTRFARAKALAADRLRALRRSSANPEVSVIVADLSPRMTLSPTRSIDAALGAVRDAQPTDQPLDTDALRELLNALRDRPARQRPDDNTPEPEGADTSTPSTPDPADRNPPTLWVFTDAGDLAPVDFPGWAGQIIPTNPTPAPDAPADQTADQPADTGPDRPHNAGITALYASRDQSDPRTARVFIAVASTATRPTGVVVRLQTDAPDAPTVPVAIEIPPATGDGPGTANRTVSLPAPGRVRIEAVLDEQGGGVLGSDDRAYADLPDPTPPRTVVFAPDARANPFLLDVLSVLAPGSVSVHAPTDLDALRAAELVVYDRVTPTTIPPVPTLGFGSAWPDDDAARADPPVRRGRERIVAWDRTHPVLRDLSLASVVFDQAVQLPDGRSAPGGTGTQPAGSETPTEPGQAGSVRVLAESAQGPVITETVGRGVRHLRVAFPLERSNWAVQVGMPIFVAAAFEHLVPGARGHSVVHTTADPITLPAGPDADRVTAIGPQGADSPGTAAAPVSVQGMATLAPLPRVGIYEIAGSTVPSVAVSLLNASESAVPTGPGAAFGVAGERDGGEGGAESSARHELWPWALLGAVVFMTLEWLLHASRARL